jgi:hypothetical protein
MMNDLVTRSLAAALALACAVPAALAAQRTLTFSGVPWEMPADSFRARLDAAGTRHVRTMENGDLRFRTETDGVVMAMVGQGRVVAVSSFVPVPADSLRARFAAARDSLRGVYGPPPLDTDSAVGWAMGLTRLFLSPRPAAGDAPPHVSYFFSGPGYDDEFARSSDVDDAYPALEPGWTILNLGPQARYAIDTVSVERRGEGVYRARLRVDFAQPIPDPSGRHDAVIYAADFDCGRRRTQLRSRTALLAGRRVREDAGSTMWIPANGNTPFGVQLDHVCRYAQRNPPPAAPGR